MSSERPHIPPPRIAGSDAARLMDWVRGDPGDQAPENHDPAASPAPQMEIIVTAGGAQEIMRFLVDRGSYVIGKDADCDIVMSITGVSSRHAMLTIDYHLVEIEDLDSTAGTRVNGRLIKERVRLWPKQQIQLGAATLELRRIKTELPPDASIPPATELTRLILPEESLRERKYEIGNSVARGGMGVILDARDTVTERTVAMKVMHDCTSPADVLRFVSEAKVTAQLEHPNIVPVHELGVDEFEQIYYTMKFVRGITLAEILGRLTQSVTSVTQQYPLGALLTIFQKICDAVAFAHSKGVIHRDLKPENIMVGDYGEVLVMDWGIAKLIDAGEDSRQHQTPGMASGLVRTRDTGAIHTMAGTVMGTPQYMSPEQAKGDVDTLDTRADIYSLGAILYHILTLRMPIEDVHGSAAIKKVIAGEIVPPAKVQATGAGRRPARAVEALSPVIMKAMALDRLGRYPLVADLQAEISAYQNGFATNAENASPFRQLALLMQRHRVVTALLGVMIALSVIFIVQVMASERRATTNERIAIVARNDAQHAATEAERAAAMVSDAHDDWAKMLGGLMGDLAGKVPPKVYDESRQFIFRQLDDAAPTGADAVASHGRSVALDTKGFIQQQAGDLAGARLLYERSLKLREDAAKAHRTPLAIHDLAVSYDNLGDDEAAGSHEAEALRFFTQSGELSRELLAQDPKNPRWQNDLAVSEGKLAAVHFNRKEYREAAAHYKAGLDLAEALLRRDATFEKWKILRSFFVGGAGRTAMRTGEFSTARRLLGEASTVLLALESEHRLNAEQLGWLQDFEKDLAALPPP